MAPKGNVVARPRVMVLSWLILLLMVLSSVFADAKVCYGSTLGCVTSPVADHKVMIYHTQVKRTPTGRGPNTRSNPQAHGKAMGWDPKTVVLPRALSNPQAQPKEMVYYPQGCRCCWFYYSKPFIRCGDICCEEGCTCF